MRKRKTVKYIASAFFVLLFCVLFAVTTNGAQINRVYLKDGGNGDGSSSDEALGSFREAVRLLKDSGGEIIICGKYTITELVNLSVLSGTSNGNNIITVKSVDDDIDYRKTDNAMLSFGNGKESANMVLAGKFVFEELNIVTNGSDKPRAIICGGYDTVFGEGIVCKKQGNAPYISVIGVSLNDADLKNKSGMVVVKSGSYYDVCAGNRDNGVDGYTAMIIYGGTFDGSVSATSIGGKTVSQGAAEMAIYGGTFNGPVGAIGGVDGEVIISINGGVFKKTIYAMGKHNVIDINGGDLKGIDLIKIADVIEKAPETDEKGETVEDVKDEVKYSVVNVNIYDWDVEALARKIEGQGVIINRNTEGGQGFEALPTVPETTVKNDAETNAQLPDNETENNVEQDENERQYLLGSKRRTLIAIAIFGIIISVAVVVLAYRTVYRKK